MPHTRPRTDCVPEQIAPKDMSLVRGGVVLVSEVCGVDDTLRTFARRLAGEGYVVTLPDLWWRTTRPDAHAPGAAPGGASALVEALVDTEAVADVRVALNELPRDLPRFVIGFCIGGMYARMASCTLPGLAGVIEFYGRVVYAGTSVNHPVQPLDLAPGLACPIQCHFGSEDTVAPPSHVDLLEERLKRPRAGATPAVQVFQYAGCGHGFMNPARAGYRHDAAELAWSRALRFLDEHS